MYLKRVQNSVELTAQQVYLVTNALGGAYSITGLADFVVFLGMG
jgi:hypothetical protein